MSDVQTANKENWNGHHDFVVVIFSLKVIGEINVTLNTTYDCFLFLQERCRRIDNLQQGLLQIDAWWNTISERISKFAYNILDVKNFEESCKVTWKHNINYVHESKRP